MLSNQQFERARRLALEVAGIELLERHRELVGRRSQRLGIRDSAGFDSLLGAAERGETTARQNVLRLVTTKFTSFFRNPRQLELAAEHAQRAVHQRGRARFWSAGAATGEEPYSVAITLIESFGCDKPPVSVLATDVEVEALAAAERGEYGELPLRSVAPARRDRFFTEDSSGRRWTITPTVRHLIEFRALNLAGEDWPLEGHFDVIFCRNVLMYLEAGRRCAVLERMAALLAPDGLLVIDPAEHLGKAGPLFTPQADGVYSRSRALCSVSAATGGGRPVLLTKTNL